MHATKMPTVAVTVRALAVLLVASGLGATAHAQQRLDVRLNDGLLSIAANAAAAEDLAAAIAEATGISVVVHGEPRTPLTADIVDEPIDTAIAQLSPSHLLVRGDSGRNDDILEAVLMMPDPVTPGSGTSQFLPSGAPAEAIATQEPDITATDGDSDTPQQLTDSGQGTDGDINARQ